VATKCPKCNTENTSDSQFCKKCATLLPSSEEISISQTETLQTPIKELSTGSTFAGRYQIIEELGKGGMGKVYRVLDKKLKEEVALKLIKPEIASDKETIERFSNELKLARKIGHRNVGRMYELMEDEGAHFITMEYVAGEDLKSFIRRSRQLTVGTAIVIAKQVCEGLAEAHRLGVIHRDLKPGNIMIDRDGNARIMDFGIARSLGGKGITGAGVVIGTPEYMSPEQVEGKETDQRSDIYSLGVILYQMVTGRVPFEGDTPLSVAVKQKTEAPQSPRTLNPQVPEDLSRAILRCLEKDPGQRYQTAEEVLADLDKIEKGTPTAERITPKKERLTSREITVKFNLKKLFIPALAFLALIAAGIFLWQIIPSRKSAPLPSSAPGQPTLAVLYFENKSGDTKLDFWRNALPELLITDLSQSKYIRVVSGDEMLTILRRLGLADAQEYSSEDIGKIAAQTRATHVLRGSFIKAGESIIITAGLQKPGTGETARTLRLEARGENDIIPKLDELTRQVKEGFNLSGTQIAGDIEKDVGKITTSSPEALKYYIEGRRLHSKVEYEQSIDYMKRAVEIDPEFAMAYRSMASAYGNMGNQAEAQKCYIKALELGSRLAENERLLIEADQLRRDENYAKAIEVYEKLLKTYPGNLTGHINLSVAYAAIGDYDRAIEQEEFAVQRLKTVITVTNLAGSYMDKGFYQKAEDICRSFLQDVEDNLFVRFNLWASYVCRRQFDLALAEAEKIQFLAPSRKGPKGQILLFRDDIAGAEEILGSDALLLIRGQFNKNVSLRLQNVEKSKGNKGNGAWAYRGLASALEKAGRYKEALQALDQYLELSAENRKSPAESGLLYLPSEQKSDLFIRGRIQAEMKSFDEAQKTAEQLKSMIEKGINKKELRYYEYILGLIELGKKNSRKAAGLFDRACGRLDFEGLGDEFNHAIYFDGLARALYESGDLDKARKGHEKITLLTMGRAGHGDIYARAYYMLGKIAEQEGDEPRAIKNYRKFLDLWKDADPGLLEVEDARKRLAGLKG
jgi:eukaryotic-like serine/threonine-protein kinase